MDNFETLHSDKEIEIFNVIQGTDVLDMIWDPEAQCAEYLSYAEDFIAWLSNNPLPPFGQVVEQLRWLFEGMACGWVEPSDSEYIRLAGQLCAVIYLD